MNVITDNWRLKLLAVGLAILMLGAVAFSENPPRSKTLSVALHYDTGSGMILINPPTKTLVTITGLADVIAPVTADNLVAVADATKVTPGQPGQPVQVVKLNVTVSPLQGITIQSPAPIAVTVDALQSVGLPVQVVAHPDRGWALDKVEARCPASPCVVTFTGPASWESNLRASVYFASAVNVGTLDAPSEPVQLANNTGTLDLSVLTLPVATLDQPLVLIHIEAHPGSTSSTVPLVDSPPSQPPPAGYRVTGVTITPVTVIITGDAAAIGRIQRVILPAVDLSGHSTDFTIQVTISYTTGVTGSATTATIRYSISPNPNVSPGP